MKNFLQAEVSNSLILFVLICYKVGKVLKIPGLVMGLHDLWKQGGKIEWKTLFDIPIIIAYKGWNIKPSLSRMLRVRKNILIKDPFLK